MHQAGGLLYYDGANYLMHKLRKLGLDLAYPKRLASHEFIITFKKVAQEKHITAMDFAKRLLDFGVHAPTTPEKLTTAPHNLPIGRLDDVLATRELDVVGR